MQSIFNKNKDNILLTCIEILLYAFLYSFIPGIFFRGVNEGFGALITSIIYPIIAIFFIFSFINNKWKVNKGIKLYSQENPVDLEKLELYKDFSRSMTAAIIAVIVGTLMTNFTIFHSLYKLVLPQSPTSAGMFLSVILSFLITNLLMFNYIDKGKYFFYKNIPNSKVRWITAFVSFIIIYYTLSLFI